MPRSCSSSDMAGTAMLYSPGTDGAAVTDVRLHGSRPSQHPESRNTRCVLTQRKPGFMASGSGPVAFCLGTAAVGAGEQLEQVAVGVLEVDAAAAVPGVDHAGLAAPGIGPVRQVLLANPAERGVELLLPDEKGVVLGGYRAAGLGEVQGHAVVGLDHEEVAEPGGRGQAEYAGEERRRPLLVAARHDGVVQLHAHADGIPGGWSH